VVAQSKDQLPPEAACEFWKALNRQKTILKKLISNFKLIFEFLESSNMETVSQIRIQIENHDKAIKLLTEYIGKEKLKLQSSLIEQSDKVTALKSELEYLLKKAWLI
jgi:hypothetical protein